jgi:bifunctional UDP-N-acetylglucosamine pyrophosphorylase/glucosamine-1-phosphate N-acetyltransferase
MGHLMAVILAAGEGKRMKSQKSKVLHKTCGRTLIDWVYHSVKDAGVTETVVVVGHKAQDVKESMGNNVLYAYQDKQLGTGHAVMQANEFFKGKEGQVLVLCGDTPLITSETVFNTFEIHRKSNNSATIITAELHNPAGYGRIVRDVNNNVLKIVEDRDASEDEKNIREINSGMYCFNITSPSLSVNISRGSPSLILKVLLISFGITTLPRSSILLTIPVAFNVFYLLLQLIYSTVLLLIIYWFFIHNR